MIIEQWVVRDKIYLMKTDKNMFVRRLTNFIRSRGLPD